VPSAKVGWVGPQTIEALNVPVTKRIPPARASLDRLHGMGFTFASATWLRIFRPRSPKAIEDGKVTRRYVTVVGRSTALADAHHADHRGQFESHLDRAAVDLEKRRRDKMRKDPNLCRAHEMRVLDGAGNEIDATSVDWQSDRTPNFTVRQDSGDGNALGKVRIDMPNPHSVYMHDTNHKEFFSG